MTITNSNKKGGRYTKKQQEERRLQVYHLHFEEGLSAVDIAKSLGVNRNTINDDIAYWYNRIGNETNAEDPKTKTVGQFLLMHLQQDRLRDSLEDTDSNAEKIKTEKLIFDIGNKLINAYSKMSDNHKWFPIKIKTKDVAEDNYDDVSENIIKDFVKYLYSSYKKSDSDIIYSEDELRFNFMMMKQCDDKYANRVIAKMRHDGLVHCIDPNQDQLEVAISTRGDHSTRYMIAKFALLRGYAKS